MHLFVLFTAIWRSNSIQLSIYESEKLISLLGIIVNAP